MPRLERLLCESKSPQEQAKTAFAMSGICYRNPNAPEVHYAVPILTASARNKDTEVRIYSIQALAAIGKAAHKATPDLVQLTRDKDAGVRMCAVEALGRIGAHSRGSLVALRIATSDTNDGVRLTAVKALELVQSNHK